MIGLFLLGTRDGRLRNYQIELGELYCLQVARIKVSNQNFDGSIIRSIIWEMFSLKKMLLAYKEPAVLLNLDGNYVGPFVIPTVTMSRDMISFEIKVMFVDP